MEENLKFLPLLLVLLLAFIVPVFLSRIRLIPLVVGEIVVGILIGPSVFNFIGRDMTLDFFAEIGLALLMFLSGLEIDFSIVTSKAPGENRYHPKSIASISFLITLLLSGLIGWKLVQWGIARDAWMIALILSTTSLGVVVPILKERGQSATPFGQTVLLAALLADFFTMFLITVHVTIISHGLSLKIMVVAILFVAALLAYRLGILQTRRLHLEKVLSDLSRTTSQVKIQGAMALMLTFVILAKFLGTEMILGAFLAGAVLSLLDKPADQQTRQRLDAIGFGFFVPLFFITVGIGFDLRSLLKDKKTLLLAPLLLIAAFLIKLISSLIFRISFKWRDTFAGGFLLSARLSLIIAASGIGLSMGIIQESTNAAFILIAAVTSTLAPVIFSSMAPSPISGPEKEIIIYGVNDTALHVARELTLRGNAVRFLITDESQKNEASRAGFQITSIRNDEIASAEIPASNIRSFMSLGASDSRNLQVAKSAVDFQIRHVIALVNDPARIPKYRDLQIQTFTPTLYQSTLLALMASNPDLFNLLSSTREDQQVRQMSLSNPKLAGQRLQDLRIGPELLVLSIRRGRDRLIPHGKTRLELDDNLTVLGNREELHKLSSQLEGEGVPIIESFH